MRFEYSSIEYFPGLQASLPFVPISLFHAGHEIVREALVDSGSMVSVLPYDIGLALGLVWEEQTLAVDLVGVLKDAPAYGVLLRGQIADYPAAGLVFGWTRKTSQDVPIILGEMNFFKQFHVHFYGNDDYFVIEPAWR